MTPTTNHVRLGDSGGSAKTSTIQPSSDVVRAIHALERCVLKDIYIPWALARSLRRFPTIPIIPVLTADYGILAPTILFPSRAAVKATRATVRVAQRPTCGQQQSIPWW